MSQQITVNVPDDMQEQVSAWKDGQDYQITVNQTGEGQFDLVSVDDESPGEDDAEGGESKEMNPGGMNDSMGTTIPTKNPAIAAMVMSKKSRSGK